MADPPSAGEASRSRLPPHPATPSPCLRSLPQKSTPANTPPPAPPPRLSAPPLGYYRGTDRHNALRGGGTARRGIRFPSRRTVRPPSPPSHPPSHLPGKSHRPHKTSHPTRPRPPPHTRHNRTPTVAGIMGDRPRETAHWRGWRVNRLREAPRLPTRRTPHPPTPGPSTDDPAPLKPQPQRDRNLRPIRNPHPAHTPRLRPLPRLSPIDPSRASRRSTPPLRHYRGTNHHNAPRVGGTARRGIRFPSHRTVRPQTLPQTPTRPLAQQESRIPGNTPPHPTQLRPRPPAISSPHPHAKTYRCAENKRQAF